MKIYPGINYTFRPKSYWISPDPLSFILCHVKGSKRRQMITEYWKAGLLKELDDQLLKDTLTEAERDRIGRIHPSFMGGEYLPDLKLGEEENVRIQLLSTTSDVISVRARPVSTGIAWRVVDEYPDFGEYVVPQEITPGPITLSELIRLLEETSHTGGHLVGGLLLGFNNYNIESGGKAIELHDFTRIETDFYPQLPVHCSFVFDDWVRENNPGEEVPTEEE